MRASFIEELKLQKAEIEVKMESLENELADYEEKLEAIEILLGETFQQLPVFPDENNKPRKNKREAVGIPKGKNSWEEYGKLILKELGGRGKSQQAIEYGKSANPKMKEKTIQDSLRGVLSRMAAHGMIDVEKAAIKSEGNVYIYKSE